MREEETICRVATWVFKKQKSFFLAAQGGKREIKAEACKI